MQWISAVTYSVARLLRWGITLGICFVIETATSAEAVPVSSQDFTQIDRYIEDSKSEDPKVRYQAVQQIVARGPLAREALSLFAELANDKEAAIRLLVAQGIGKFGPLGSVGVPTLLQLVKDGEEAVRIEAIQSLGRIGEGARGALSVLEEIAAKGSKVERVSAVASLSDIGRSTNQTVPTLSHIALHDSEWLVRSMALDGLASIRDPAADAALRQILNSSTREDFTMTSETLRTRGNWQIVLTVYKETLLRRLPQLLVISGLLVGLLILWRKRLRKRPSR